MSFKSVLDYLGSDVKKVFAWAGSPKGQAEIATGEALAEAVFPPATGMIAIGNVFLNEAIKTQALATAAGAQEGSSTQKAAVALNAAGPQAIAFAQQYGLPAPTAAQLQAANTAIVAFLNAFSAPATPAA